jgi:outer membrane lipoprotein SlyB
LKRSVHTSFRQASAKCNIHRDPQGNAMKVSVALNLPWVLLLSACASHPDPIVDMKGVDKSAFAVDWVDCESYSDQVIVAKGAARGATGGAIAGAAAGAIGGNADAGAGYGAVWGATRSTTDGAQEKEMVFKRCLRGRGYRVLN